MTEPINPRWNDPVSDPLADLAKSCRDITASMLLQPSFSFVMPGQLWNRIEHLVARATKSKRGYRRWRGARKAARRRLEARNRNPVLYGKSVDRIIIDDPWVDGPPDPAQRQAAIDLFVGSAPR